MKNTPESNAPEPSQETASLVRRLAGPSTTKAGLALDQSEINRVIAEASKGSKFYDNEKRKDKDLTERISRILKQRDEALHGVDLAKVEASVDKLLVELEAQRDLSQYVVHVDMDAFYASVELLHDPTLAGKPFGVGRGVLTTASYEARKYGVRSGMPAFIAKKLCPELIIVSNNFSRYAEMSGKVMDVFKRYDPNMCVAGCDEGYLNITSYCLEHNMTADDCVREMREKVKAETQLTASAGIAPNKMLAKICSDKNKPNGQFHLPFERQAIIDFMKDLSIRKVPGVGRVNERLLDCIGIKTCGDIYTQRATLSLMDKQFGLRFLLRTHLGIASNVVQAGQREERKSIGSERTFHTLSERTKIIQKLEEIATELEEDMTSSGWVGRTVTLKYKLDTYQVFTRAKALDRWISSKEDLFSTGKELLIPELPLRLRLIGLRVTKLKDLRADDKVAGIKRFFESVPTHPSPSKKRRIEDVDATVAEEVGDEDTMPGFHDDDLHNDLDEQELALHDDEELAGRGGPLDASLRPGGAQPLVGPCLEPPTRHPSKPRSASSKPKSSRGLAPDAQTCPICGREVAGDNSALNEHVDFCLSKGEIMKAVGMAGEAGQGKKVKQQR